MFNDINRFVLTAVFVSILYFCLFFSYKWNKKNKKGRKKGQDGCLIVVNMNSMHMSYCQQKHGGADGVELEHIFLHPSITW